MSVFADYAQYYNAIYKDKSYRPEVDFVLTLAEQQGVHPRTVLDLGCGTGRHALELARQGIAVTGVDISPNMLAHAAETLQQQPRDSGCPQPTLLEGDARNVRLSKKFDMVTSLFHVMSYQNTEEDALALLRTAHAHLDPGGLFIFDFWYGPCVLRERPEYREKVLDNQGCRVTRRATPELLLHKNRVDVHYDIMLENDAGKLTQLQETHCMRYWFLPELCYLARQAAFTLVGQGAWLSQEPPTDASWGAWILLQK